MSGGVPLHWRKLVAEAKRPPRSGPIAVLDVGSTKLCCYIAKHVAKLGGDQGFPLIGRGYQAAHGLRAGEVVDTEEAEISILAAMHEAEVEAGEQVREVALVWSGGQPSTRTVRVEVPLMGRPVDEDDIRRALDTARGQVEGQTEGSREAMRVVPLEARVDGGRALLDPVGLAGEDLSLLVGVTTVAREPLRDLLACLERCHLRARSVFVGAHAAGVGCLTADEAKRGVLVLDLGGGVTGAALFHGGRLAAVDGVPYGGEHVTLDIVGVLHTTRAFAERAKVLYGGVQERACDRNMRLDVPVVADAAVMTQSEVPRVHLTRIIAERARETLQLAKERIERSNVYGRTPPRSVVLTGGGASGDGMAELAEEVFGLPARVGCPSAATWHHGVEDSPCCAAASGSLALALGGEEGLAWREGLDRPPLSQGLHKLGQWLKENFVS